jgi:hypothetical protein
MQKTFQNYFLGKNGGLAVAISVKIRYNAQ